MAHRKTNVYTRRANPVHHLLMSDIGLEICVTERQYQLLALLGEGLSVRDISRRLKLSEQDIHNRLNRLSTRTNLDREKLAWVGARLVHE